MPVARPFACLLFAIVAAFCWMPAARAHEVRPAYLQIREAERHVYDLMWKTPARGNARLALNLELPRSCHQAGAARLVATGGAFLEYSRISCTEGLPGQAMRIDRLAAVLTDVIVRFEPLSGQPKTLRVAGDAPVFSIPARQSGLAVVQAYLPLGIGHILSGYDHLLFVLCLIMLAGTTRRIVGAVTLFTVAHSITLTATTLGLVRVKSAPVEAVIALSIMFLAAEIIKQRQGGTSLVARWPWIASFVFGLLHGFGFASALREAGLPEESIPLALLSFNLGVEAGQLLFVAAVLAVMAAGRHLLPSLKLGRPAASYLAGTVAAFWFIERSLAIIR